MVEVTSVLKKQDGQPFKITLTIGPGIYFTEAPDNKATAVSTVSGVILIEETVEQLVALLNQENTGGI